MHRKFALCLLLAFCLLGCDEPVEKTKQQRNTEPSSTSAKQTASVPSEEKRFVFPTKSSPFPESSVALDTISGRLCKTYPWEDSSQVPKGLLLCSDLTALPQSSFTGATKAYRGFTYKFDGIKWVKGLKAFKYNPSTQGEDPWGDDQYDPLGLFSKEEKAKRTLTEEQIRSVASRFGVTYAEAWEDATAQGYRVPSQP
jgi:hypothetical protein